MRRKFTKGYILGVSLGFLIITSSLLSYKHYQTLTYHHIYESYKLQRKQIENEESIIYEFIKQLKEIENFEDESIIIKGCIVKYENSEYELVCQQLKDLKMIIRVDQNKLRITDLIYE